MVIKLNGLIKCDKYLVYFCDGPFVVGCRNNALGFFGDDIITCGLLVCSGSLLPPNRERSIGQLTAGFGLLFKIAFTLCFKSVDVVLMISTLLKTVVDGTGDISR